jgi:hypothetical protein
MEDVIRKELEHQKTELVANINQNSWWRFIGLQGSTIEQKYRQQCVKELERLLISRKQLDNTTKNNYAVGLISGIFIFKNLCIF